MKIVQVGDAVLRDEARPLTTEEICSSRIGDLIETMRKAMHAAPGVGLAAPQIGIGLQLAVIEDKADYMREISPEVLRERERKPVPFHVIINPKLRLGGVNVEFFEGCLSLAGFTAVVPRARTVEVECRDHRGEEQIIHASGWYARILQHEIDHLRGKLYIDRMRSETFSSMDNYLRFWKDKPVSEVTQLVSRKL